MTSPTAHDRANVTLAVIVGVSLLFVTAGANLQVPLYPAYAAQAGAGAGMTAIVFSAYAVALLVVLIGLAGLSDRIGRRPVILASVVLGAVATAMVWWVPTLQVLLVARLVQGFSVGFALVAGTTMLTELLGDAFGTSQAASVTTGTTSLGFGMGALITSAFLFWRVDASPLSYPLGFAGLVACAIALWFAPKSSADTVGNRAMPLVVRPVFPPALWLPTAAIATAWSASGLVIAVLPVQLAEFGLAPWAGPILLAVNGTGVVLLPHVRRMAPAAAVRLGLVLLPIGFAVLVWGAAQGALPWLILGAILCGASGYGYVYLGGLTQVSSVAPALRARAVSGFFFWAYVGFSVPSIIVGYAADTIGMIPALSLFSAAIAVVSVALFVWSLRQPVGQP